MATEDRIISIPLGAVDSRRITEEEKVECIDFLQPYFYSIDDYEDVDDLYIWQFAQSQETFIRLMQEKGPNFVWPATTACALWEVVADLWLEHSDHSVREEKALVEVLDSRFGEVSKYYMASYLLDRPTTNPMATNDFGETALHLAINFESIMVPEREMLAMKVLKKWGHQLINTKDSGGITPLLQAILVDGDHCQYYSGASNLLNEMVEVYKADVNAVDDSDFTPLHAAAQKGRVQSAKYLLDQGAEIDAVDEHKCTALHYAAKLKSKDVIKLLIKKKADVNGKQDQDGCTALHLIAKWADKDIVAHLIENGADVNRIKDLEGNTALDIAERKNHRLEVHNLLYEHSSTSKKDKQHSKKIQNRLQGKVASRDQLQDDSEDDSVDDLVASEIREMSHYGVMKMMMLKKQIPSIGGRRKLNQGLFVNGIIENSAKSNTVNLKESTRAMLDKFVLGKKRVNCEVFDAVSNGNFTKHEKFNPRTASLLDAIVEMNSTELALHPAVKTVVDHKWSFLAIKMLFWLSFGLNLVRTFLFTFALLIAARPDLDNPECYRDGWDRVVRLILEILTFILFLAEPIYKVIAVCITKWTKTSGRNRSCPRMMMSYVNHNWLQMLAIAMPFTIIPFRAATTWCASTGEGYCALPVVSSTGNYSTDINVSCTVASHVQWIFAAVAYLFNAIIMLEFLAVFKPTGVYVRILKEILKSDIWKFIILYLVFVLTFGFFFYFLLRSGVVITSDGQLISDVKLFAPNISYAPSIILFGVRMLMESGGISRGYFTDDDNIMYNGYQWFLVIIYTTIMLFMSVVLLSLLIAQMSNLYSEVEKDAKGTFALARARVVVRLQKQWLFTVTNVILSKLCIKKTEFYEDYIWIVPEETKPMVEKENTTEFNLTDMSDRARWTRRRLSTAWQ